MKHVTAAAISLTLGAAFGAATSLVNRLATPADAGGSPIAGTALEPIARVASLILDSGWAWAALAVAVGWLVGEPRARAAVAAVLALLAATTAYSVMDSQPQDLYYWGPASVILGPVLGAAGATIRQPGVVGLLASLIVPAGAVLQIVLTPPGGSGPLVRAEAIWARGIVLAAAALAAALLIHRFVAQPATPAPRA
jgi:Family of unknown function (DUF6518)